MLQFPVGEYPFIVLHPEVLYSLRNNAYYREVVTLWPIEEPIPKDLVGWINKTTDGRNDPLVFVFTRSE